MFKKWRKTFQWKASRWWYGVRIRLGWWYCDKCEKMHSPIKDKFDFYGYEQYECYECYKGVYDIPVPNAFEDEPEYFHLLTLNLHRVE